MTRGALSGKSKLRMLNLSNNRLKDELLLTLCRGLKASNPDLKELNLSKNMMGDFSAIVLGDFLEHAISLELLDLSWNRITSYGGTKIFQGLKAGCSVRSVNIAYNLLGKSSTFEFVEAVQLAVNEDNLKHLDLSYNRMNKVV